MLFVCTSFPERSQDGVVIESGQLVLARYRTSQTAWLEDGEAGVGAFAKPHVLSAQLDVLWFAPKVLYLTELREDFFVFASAGIAVVHGVLLKPVETCEMFRSRRDCRF